MNQADRPPSGAGPEPCFEVHDDARTAATLGGRRARLLALRAAAAARASQGRATFGLFLACVSLRATCADTVPTRARVAAACGGPTRGIGEGADRRALGIDARIRRGLAVDLRGRIRGRIRARFGAGLDSRRAWIRLDVEQRSTRSRQSHGNGDEDDDANTHIHSVASRRGRRGLFLLELSAACRAPRSCRP